MYSHDKRDQRVHELFLKQVKQGISLSDHIKEVHLRGGPRVRQRNGWNIHPMKKWDDWSNNWISICLLVTVVKYKTLNFLCTVHIYLVILIQLHNQCVQQPNTVSRHPTPAPHCWACLNYWTAVTNVDQSVLQQQSQSASKQLILYY